MYASSAEKSLKEGALLQKTGGSNSRRTSTMRDIIAILPVVSSVICAVYVVIFAGTLSRIDTLLDNMNQTKISLIAGGLLDLETCALKVLPGC